MTVVFLWELMEFTVDTIFNTNYQDSVYDTKMDVATGLAGGIFPLLFYRLIKIKVAFIKER